MVNSQHPERDSGFVVHWLNNKELHFTLEAEKILTELSRGVPPRDDPREDEETDAVDHESIAEDKQPDIIEVSPPITTAPTTGRSKCLCLGVLNASNCLRCQCAYCY